MVETATMRSAHPRRRATLLLLASVVALLVALACAGVAAAAEGEPVRRPISATIVGVNDNHEDSCAWYIGIEIPHVAGASGYEVEYYDDYWKRVEHRAITQGEAATNDGPAPDGRHHLGITGGWYSPPCNNDPIGTGRFPKGAKAWAVFPADFKPKATLTVTVTLPEGGASVGQTVDATVLLTAGEAALTDVRLAGLTALGNGATIVKRPGGLGPFRLAAGASRAFVYRVRAEEPGATSLRASASGKARSKTVRGSGAASLRVARDALAVTIGTVPEKLRLEVDDDGNVLPQTVEVTVKLTNTGDSTLANVQLLSLRPEPVVRGQRLDQLAFPGGALPVTVGDLPPRSTATRTFTLEVTGDGLRRFRALALYANAAGLNGREVGLGGAFETSVPLLFFTGALEDGVRASGTVTAGDGYFISGNVRNLSDHQQLCLRPLEAAETGNADFFGPVDLERFKDRESIVPPVAGGLRPGDRLPWGLWVRTERLGGTRSEIRFDPGATRVDPGESCDVARVMRLPALPPEDVRTTPGSTEHRVAVDVRDPQFPPLGAGAKLYNVAGGFLVGAGVTTGQMLQSSFDLAAAIVREGTTPENYLALAYASYDSAVQAQAIAQAYANMHASAAMLGFWWANATPAERQRFLAEVRQTLERSRDDAWATAAKVSEAVTADLMHDVEAYYTSSDDPAVWRALGRRTGGIASQVAIDIATGKAAAAIGAKVLSLQDEFRQLAGASQTFTRLRGIPAGKLLNPVEMQRLWGMTVADMRNFNRIARKHGVLIGVRGRSPGSVRQLRLGAVWKHENLKPKNVSKIDIEFLGFDKKDESLVVFKRYSDAEKAAIQQRVNAAGLDPERLAEVTNRMQKRFGEADEHLAKIRQMSQRGEIDIGFNAGENGFDIPTGSKKRGFRLEQVEEPNGSTTYRPLQENTDLKPGRRPPDNCKRAIINARPKILCRVTGDMDGVYITNPKGGPLDPELLLQVWADLEEAGWQHPETLTWAMDLAKGGFWFDKKADILQGHRLGGEALAEFSPDGVRATYLSIARSRLINGATGDWFANIVGGYHSVMR